MNVNEHISQEDLALHALGSLTEAEAAETRAHLAVCAACRGDLAEFMGDAAMVGLSAPQSVLPKGARQRFLDRIAADAGQSVKPAGTKVIQFRWSAWVPWAIAATLGLVAVSLSLRNHALDDALRSEDAQVAALKEESAQARRVVELLNSHSAQRVLLTASKANVEPSGRAIYLAQSGSLVFQANNLKLLAEGKTYELWLIPTEGKPIPAGLFKPDAAGYASVVLPALPKGVAAKAFGVTIEKAEGSDTPTAPIVLAGAAAGE